MNRTTLRAWVSYCPHAQVRFMGRGKAGKVDPAAVASLVELLGIPLDGSTDEILRRFRRFSSVAEQEKI